jgi:hypothetical protein
VTPTSYSALPGYRIDTSEAEAKETRHGQPRQRGGSAAAPVKIKVVAVGGLALRGFALGGVIPWQRSYRCAGGRSAGCWRAQGGQGRLPELAVTRLQVDDFVLGGRVISADDFGSQQRDTGSQPPPVQT